MVIQEYQCFCIARTIIRPTQLCICLKKQFESMGFPHALDVTKGVKM